MEQLYNDKERFCTNILILYICQKEISKKIHLENGDKIDYLTFKPSFLSMIPENISFI